MKDIQSVSRKNTLIFTALWGFISGIFVTTFVPVSPLGAVLIVVVALAVYYADKNLLILVALVFFAFGAFRYDVKDFHELRPAGNTGIVVSEPEHRDADTRFVVRSDTGERVLVSTGLLSSIQYGDEVKLLGTPKPVKPGDYADYLAKDDIFYTLDRAKLETLSHGRGNFILAQLFRLKEAFVERVREILPEPEASLLSGLIVSGKQALPSNVLENFRRAGIVHIVVLSGYNITIIAEFLLAAFAFWGKRRAAIISVAGVLVFVLMSGAQATVVRGAIMVTLIIGGRIFGREGSAPRILLSTAALMLLINPKILVYDASFQLSFLAMLGLIYLAPIIQQKLAVVRYVAPWLAEILAATLATQAFVLPFILYNMGSFSLVFLLSNIAVLLILPYTMLVGFIAVLTAFISSALAWPISFVTHLLLKWVLFVADFLGNLSFASLQIENFPLWGSLLMYSGLIFMLWRWRDLLPHSASSNS